MGLIKKPFSQNKKIFVFLDLKLNIIEKHDLHIDNYLTSKCAMIFTISFL
jgi:hypothetical protein